MTVGLIAVVALSASIAPIELLSASEHHSIEVLLPGPALIVRHEAMARRSAGR